MARVNTVHLLGYLFSDPRIVTDDNTGNPLAAQAVLVVVRPDRDAGDMKSYMKLDNPRILSMDEKIMREMVTWEANDIVLVKGTVASRTIRKPSFCSHEDCGAKNSQDGVLVYVNPIFAKKIDVFPDGVEKTKENALEYIRSCREISNEVSIFGTLFREPKKLEPRAGLTVTQYPIIADRKFRIRTDPIDVKRDYIWIKSYGDNALSDRDHLRIGSEVIVDGCLQARSVQRHSKCAQCGREYTWKDRAMEIVPFAVEYVANYYTDQEISENREARTKAKVEQARAKAGLSGALPPLADEDSEED